MSDDTIFFFLLPHEQIDKRKRIIKEKRKELECITNQLNPDKNDLDFTSEQVKKLWDKNTPTDKSGLFGNLVGEFERRKVGLGKRLNMTEML